VEITFQSRKLARLCASAQLLEKELGKDRGGRLARHLVAMEAAATLAEFAKLPQVRCHQLKGNRNEQLSVDVTQPYRLVVEVAQTPIPRKADRGLDWERITALVVVEITDTH